MPRKDGTPTKQEDQLRAFRADLTRRKAWGYIAFIVVWNAVGLGLLVMVTVQDGTPALAFLLPNLLIGVPLAIGIIWGLLYETRPGAPPPAVLSDYPAPHWKPAPPTPAGTCRLCGMRLRPTEDLVRLDRELFHVVCAEPAMSDTAAWHERELGTLNELVEGIGRSTVV